MALSQDAVKSMLDAMKIISSAEMKNISYDTTIICTIVDNSHAEKESYYTVSPDDGVKFKAYVLSAEDTTKYKVNDQVYVKIPQGDYSRQKVIEGYYVAESAEIPATYISPLNGFLDMKSLSAANNTDAQFTDVDKALIANKSKEVAIWHWSIDPLGNNADDLQMSGLYDTLAIAGDFKCLLDKYRMYSGSYGLRLELVVRLHATSDLHTLHSVKLDSSEMFGNPYAFSLYSTQAKAFDISSIGIIDGMTLYFYQDDNFNYYDAKGNVVRLSYEAEEALKIEPSPNILLKNVYVALGSNLTRVADNSLKIYSLQDNAFKFTGANDSTNRKDIGFVWYNKNDKNEYVGFSDGIVQIDDTTQKIIPYDEIDYLKRSAANNRLQAQMGKAIPTDKNGLEMSANVSDAESLINNIISLVQINLVNTLGDLWQRTQSMNQIKKNPEDETKWISATEYLNDDLKAKAKAYGQEFETESKALIKWYKEALAAAAAIQTHQTQNTSPTEEKSFTVPNQLFYSEDKTGLINKWEAFVPYFYNGNFYLNDLKNAIANKYNGFQSVYDTYSIKIQKIFDSIQENFDKLTKLLKDKEKLVSSTNALTKDPEDTFSYQYDINVGIEEFKPAEFSGDDNRYCIYWYKYDEAATGDEILEPGWRRFLPGEIIKSGLAESSFEMPQNLGLPSEYTNEGEDLYLVAQAKPEESFLTVFLNPEKKEEKFKLVLFYNHEKFVSDEIVFTNADPIVDTTTLDVNGSIKIAHGNRSNENYQTFYNSTNTLINEADASFGRGLSVSYDGVLGDNDSLIDAQVFWYVPKHSSMLSADINRLTGTYKFSTDYKRRAEVIADTTVRMGPGIDYSQIIESTTKDEEGNDVHTYLGYKINDSVEVYTKDGEYYSLTLENKKGLNGRWIHESAIQIVDNGEDYMEGFACFYKTIGSVDKKNENGEVIKDKNDKAIKVVNPDDLTFEYKIKNYYVPTALNNTIFCIVKKAEYKFETSISMTFGTQGTSGTDYTLLVQPSTSQRAVQGTKALPLSIQLFNYNNEEVPITAKTIAEQNQASLNIKWAGPSIYLSAISNEEVNLAINSLEVDLNKELKSITDYCGIIQVGTTVTDGKYHKTTNEVDDEGNKKTRTIELAVKYPIPYSPHNYYIEGATTIIYDSNGGNPVYYKEPYRLYDGTTHQHPVRKDENNKDIPIDITWEVWCYMQKNAIALHEDAVAPLYKFNLNEICDLATEPKEIPADIQQAVEFYRGYMPRLDDENRLIPANMYISEVYLDDDNKEQKGHINAYPVVCAYSGEDLVWAQPIVIDQNRYPNAVVNAWDGEFEINEKNGTIMSSMVGAGYKNSDNTYSGVLMGDISGGEQLATGNKTDVGLYGFHHGEQSFGLNIDGTAFFGKSGRGRINIDGNKGTIESASYSQNLDSGMRIDLDDGSIDMRGVAKIGMPDSSILNSAQLGLMELGSNEMGLAPSTPGMTEEEFNSLPDDDELFGKYDNYYDYRKDVGLLNAVEWEADKGKYETYRDYIKATIGKIKSYKQSAIHIDVQSPYFTIHSSNQVQKDKHIMHIANDEYYLQSDNYVPGAYCWIDGVKINENGYLYKEQILMDKDTQKAVLDINGNNIQQIVYVDKEGNPLLTITSAYTDTDGNIIPEYKDPENGESLLTKFIEKVGQGTKIDLQHGTFDAYNLFLTSKNVYLDSRLNADPFFVIRDEDGCNLFYAGQKNYYLKSHGYSVENKVGFKLDLVNNTINGYDFRLQANSSDPIYNGSYILVDSGKESKTSPQLIVHYVNNEQRIDAEGNEYLTPIHTSNLLEIHDNIFSLKSTDWWEDDILPDIEQTIPVKVQYVTGILNGASLNIRTGPEVADSTYTGEVQSNGTNARIYNAHLTYSEEDCPDWWFIDSQSPQWLSITPPRYNNHGLLNKDNYYIEWNAEDKKYYYSIITKKIYEQLCAVIKSPLIAMNEEIKDRYGNIVDKYILVDITTHEIIIDPYGEPYYYASYMNDLSIEVEDTNIDIMHMDAINGAFVSDESTFPILFESHPDFIIGTDPVSGRQGRWVSKYYSNDDKWTYDLETLTEEDVNATIITTPQYKGTCFDVANGKLSMFTEIAFGEGSRMIEIDSQQYKTPFFIGESIEGRRGRGVSIDWDGSLSGGSAYPWNIKANGQATFKGLQAIGGSLTNFTVLGTFYYGTDECRPSEITIQAIDPGSTTIYTSVDWTGREFCAIRVYEGKLQAKKTLSSGWDDVPEGVYFGDLTTTSVALSALPRHDLTGYFMGHSCKWNGVNQPSSGGVAPPAISKQSAQFSVVAMG